MFFVLYACIYNGYVIQYTHNHQEVFMAIIYQHDKRSGITYAYESHSFWDKEKKTSRAKRTLIGRVDPETGEIVPTDGRNKAVKELGEKLPDYKLLCEKLKKESEAKDVLISALKNEITKLKGTAIK
jgi:hypothetical protein